MNLEALIMLILVFGICIGGFAISLILSSRENK